MTEKKEKKRRAAWKVSIQTKLVSVFAFTAVVMFLVNLILYSEISQAMKRLDAVYATNVSLTDLKQNLEETQKDVLEYLSTKSTDSLESYYRNEQQVRDMLGELNEDCIENEYKMLEKNIRNMGDTYLQKTEETIQAKRGRNVERYKTLYDEAVMDYQYIQSAIYNLNNLQFQKNSGNYRIMTKSLNYMEIISSVILCVVTVINFLILSLLGRTITEPLRILANTANEVAKGNFDIRLEDSDQQDEVGIVTHAFVKMIRSLKEYIEKTRESMEKEQKMKERELLMETHLKDAQLKYLQAQINPHFLFNSLNAGAQLAMLEDAEQTSIFIEKMADFFRYNVRKIEETTTLEEEIEAVDNYVYILNVRFAGDIHYEKEIAMEADQLRMPSMILQPIVENAVNHGIRNVDWEGQIRLAVEKQEEEVIIRVKDNGQGMTQQRIREVLDGKKGNKENTRDAAGIAMDNVISRLELFFGEKNLLRIFSEGPGKGTEVEIHIPDRSVRPFEGERGEEQQERTRQAQILDE